MMKRIVTWFFILLFFASCKKDPAALLVGRWDFMALDMPGLDDLLADIGNTDESKELIMQKFLLGNKLILRKDSSFDMVLLKQYVHGSWQYDASMKYLLLKDASAGKMDLIFHIDTVTANTLKADLDEFGLDKLAASHAKTDNGYRHLMGKTYCQFLLSADTDRFNEQADDPYSKDNNWWRMKPSQPETDEQIKKRVLNHLAFWKQLFTDAGSYERPYVAYNWFESPLVIAVNGVQLSFYDDVKKQWDSNFFDSNDAQKGYELMRTCFSKKINYIKTENKYKRSEDIINQLTSNLRAASPKP